MKIAITSYGQDRDSPIDTRFGRAEYFLIHDTETNSWEGHSNKQGLTAAHGAGIQAAQNILGSGAEVLVTGHVGPKAFKVLNAGGMEIFSIGETADKLYANQIPELLAAGKVMKIMVPNAIDIK